MVRGFSIQMGWRSPLRRPRQLRSVIIAIVAAVSVVSLTRAALFVHGPRGWKVQALPTLATRPLGSQAAELVGAQFTLTKDLQSLRRLPRAAEPPTAVLERPNAKAREAEPNTEEDQEQLRIISVTLLQRIGGAEEILMEADGVDGDREIDLREFQDLLAKLELECTKEQSTKIFNMMDADGSGTLCISELRTKLRESDAITEMYNESLQNVAFTVGGAAVLAAGFAYFQGLSAGLDFATAYIVEDSLSVDNLFVFLLLFKYFKVPPALQTVCLNLGIYGAVILRGAFIFVGLAAIKAFEPLLLVFAAFLLYASFQALSAGDDDDDDDEEEKPPEFVEQLSKFLPTTSEFDGDKLFVKGNDGSWLATPLALCIIAVELSDILFAVDSIPAVFAVTSDPAIVFASNIAAILGLRSLYQVLSVAVQDLAYLEKAVAVVLGFVGLKLGLEVFHFEVSSLLSLAVILSILGLGVILSLYEQDRGEYEKRLAKSPVILKVFQSLRSMLG